MKAVVAAFNQEKALVGAFSVITNLRMEIFKALYNMVQQQRCRPGQCRAEISSIIDTLSQNGSFIVHVLVHCQPGIDNCKNI